ncbi:Ser/Thr protein phosphatase superfamily [Acanthamoeba castellanii str. Neff]|uniref:Ser/Thr protein phosphatase superfamily n=1 Tax=Acanthamoeba castellanii (strain ATCC 30010 / Neff) TaxID=1257118 RepID=L8GQG8_ACACF|nr:Ser/Thr protein phosphatase superfamily [Acanthamoeba castellanii str. Neff]ELR14381.1 Ser/Thr protein phosphatase superfamily [Acanthamoeba castellanii str. Neff]
METHDTAGGWRLQLASDLHLEAFVGSFGLTRFKELLLEKYNAPGGEIPVLGECLALLGDIGYPTRDTYREFLLQQAERFETVLVVAGNHEFYAVGSVTPDYDETKARIRSICSEAPKNNLHFLDRTSLLSRVSIVMTFMTVYLGFTLHRATAFWDKSSSDYKKIFVIDAETGQKRKSTVRDSVGWHEAAWLKEELAMAVERGEKVVVLTHHAPTFEKTSSPKFTRSVMTSIYASDLAAMFGDPVVAWLFGHTHWSSTQKVGSTLVASNQAGYFNEAGSTNYDPFFCLSFPPSSSSGLLTLSTS